jgi:hypothetical protein
MKTTRRIEVRIETQKTTVVRVKRRNQKTRFRPAAEDEANAPRDTLTSGEPVDAERDNERTKGAKQ